MAWAAVRSKAVVLLVLTCCLLLLRLCESIFVYVLLYVALCPSSFAIKLMAKGELVPLLSLSSWCLVIVLWLSL